MTALDQIQLVKLGDICHTNPLITITPSTSVSEATELMKKHNITCLPVLQGDNVIGILDIRNILLFLICTRYLELLSVSLSLSHTTNNPFHLFTSPL